MNSSPRRLFAASLLMLAAATGCQRPAHSATKAEPPAKVAQTANETKLNTVELTPEAETRLGLETAAVESRRVARQRTYGGEITLPTGASLVVLAPINGTLKPAKTDKPLAVGEKVARGQSVFVLSPLLSPERDVLTPAERVAYAQAQMQLSQAQVDAEGQLQQAKVQVDAAQIALDRAERLLREQSGTARVVDEGRAQLELAQKTHEAASARKQLVDSVKLDAESGQAEPLAIPSPREGIIRAEFAAPGEVVPAGAPLFEVVDLDRVWVRVPVYAGEVAEVSQSAPAQVKGLSEPPGSPGLTARPVSAPPTAVPQAAAVDLYYELENRDGKFRPGQRVSATLTLEAQQDSLGIPWSAVVQDIYGGTWVYEQTAEHTFVRRRVEVPYVVDNWAVLSAGPAEGAKIVTAGVAELFGAEFGFGK
ncbi:MAG TPA: efflux RND transporter periplasmic adaptor subunit [Pirellulales bacterium]|nr:efflux RND transporter periplasmic adaptor subunit [Pirellulales bacterium]